jgi:hypothetical protein
MNRWWMTVPLAVIAAVPVSTAASALVVAIGATACMLCALGICLARSGPITAGSVIAVIDYAAALWTAGTSVDIVGPALFGTALLFLLDLSEFIRRFRGAEIARDVIRTQIAYWLGRAAVIAGAVTALTMVGFVLSVWFPDAGRTVVAGLGATLAFVGALMAGVVRRPNNA